MNEVENKKDRLTIVLFSDTHGKHGELTFPEIDIDMAIFAGDAGTYKNPYQNKSGILDFIDWYSSLKNIKHKIWIAGNHCTSIELGLVDARELSKEKGLIYLEDETIEVEGLKIFGSPQTPWFHSWAYNKHRGEDIKKYWDLIESETDIVISHGPPKGILDRCIDGREVGCDDLLTKIKEINPLCFISGHIHEAYGHKFIDGTHFFNVSVLNYRYDLVNKPRVIEISKDKELKIIQ